MADLIIIRIHPVKPSTGADFKNSLAGLTITVFDRSYKNATSGTRIGAVSFNSPDPDQGAIVLHVTPPPSLPGDPPPDLPFSVATAAIVIHRPAGSTTDYQTADLLLKITRNGIPIADTSINYNVNELLGVPLPLPPAPAKGDSPPGVAAKKSLFYMALTPVSFYWAMPVLDTDPNKAHLDVPTDGTPPNFDDLRRAVEKVLASDPTGTVDPTKLTVERCRNIAYEIVWNRTLIPLPVPPNGDLLEQFYIKPDSDKSDNPKERQQFESNLTSYYIINNSRADLLTKYVYALSAALACQSASVNAAQVGFTFPILLSGAPSPGKIAAAIVGLSRQTSPPGPLFGFNVPAPYFYALASILPPDVGIDLRYRMATIGDEKQLATTLQTAIDGGIISANSPIVLTTAPSPAGPPAGTPISIEQAARRLRALGAASGVSPVCAPGLASTLVGHWLAYNSNNTGGPEPDLAGFWSGSPTPLTAQDIEDHRDLVSCALTKLSLPDQLPDNLVTAIKTSGFPIASTNDLKAITTDQWTAIFTANLNLLVDVTGPGSIPQRVGRFIRRLANFFNVTPSTAPASTTSLSGPPQLDKSINDPIATFLNTFTPGFLFGQATLDPTSPAFTNAVAKVFPNDLRAQAWLVQTLLTIDTVYFLSDVVGTDSATHLSIAEALYARGFVDKALTRHGR